MRYSLCVMILAITVSGCSSSPAYKAAQGSEYGYRESAITEDRYRISFKARGDNAAKTMDYALQRAAEVTLLKGYDWFVVVDRKTLVESNATTPASDFSMHSSQTTVRDCGILGCRTSYYPSRTYGMTVDTGNSPDNVEVILEIRMGGGAGPADGDSYDAKAVIDQLNW